MKCRNCAAEIDKVVCPYCLTVNADSIRWFIKKMDWEMPSYSRFSLGWGNGYIVLPKEHPWFGKDYNEIEVDVHGGLTFAEFGKNLQSWSELKTDDYDKYVIGFDTGHGTYFSKEEVEQETLRLYKQGVKVFK